MFRPELTVQELTKKITTQLLEKRMTPESGTHAINSATHECTLAIKAINDKLSEYIEGLSMTASVVEQRSGSLEKSMVRSSVDNQKLAKEKLQTAYSAQIQYYEQEIARLTRYRQKITAGSYDAQLTNELSDLRASNTNLGKETAELKLKAEKMIANLEKKQNEVKYKRHEQLFRLRYFEDKVARMESKKDRKEEFIKQLESECNKAALKIEELRAKFGEQLEGETGEKRARVRDLRQQITKAVKLNDQIQEKFKKQAMVAGTDIEKLKKENKQLSDNLTVVTREAEEQAKKVHEEETKVGKSIDNLKELILQERMLSKQEERKSALFENGSRVNSRNKTTLPNLSTSGIFTNEKKKQKLKSMVSPERAMTVQQDKNNDKFTS